MVNCKRCGGEVVQKNRTRLILVGIVMILSLGAGWLFWQLWIPGILLAIIGLYLLTWATLGQGRWCRGCKRFDGV